MVENRQRIEEDEIDLKELFLTLWAKKVFIVGFTLVIVIVGVVYSLSKTPVYEIKAVVEVGSFNSNSNSNSNNYIENPQNLIKKLLIINKENVKTQEKSTLQDVSLVKSTPNLIEIIVASTSNQEGKVLIEKIIKQVKEEHNEKIDSYKALIQSNINNLMSQINLLEKSENKFEGSVATKFDLISKINELELSISPHSMQPTKLIGKIITDDSPVKPKKKLIVAVAFVTGFILAVFLVFFMQFIKGFKEEKETIK
jgi:uncharacterized protein involved in exopolysaccharide biosynthesis